MSHICKVSFSFTKPLSQTEQKDKAVVKITKLHVLPIISSSENKLPQKHAIQTNEIRSDRDVQRCNV